MSKKDKITYNPPPPTMNSVPRSRSKKSDETETEYMIRMSEELYPPSEYKFKISCPYCNSPMFHQISWKFKLENPNKSQQLLDLVVVRPAYFFTKQIEIDLKFKVQ